VKWAGSEWPRSSARAMTFQAGSTTR
jgi:hypothetical protein